MKRCSEVAAAAAASSVITDARCTAVFSVLNKNTCTGLYLVTVVFAGMRPVSTGLRCEDSYLP